MKIAVTIGWAAMVIGACGARAEPVDMAPSFDCGKAQGPVETTICEDFSLLGFMDRTLSGLYREALEQEISGVKMAQRAWLKKRNACGGDRDCISSSYIRRMSALAGALGDATGITGKFGYALSEETNFGELWIARHGDGALSGGLQTISGPTFHICTLAFAKAMPIGDAWLFSEASEDADAFKRCTVLIRPSKQGVRIDSDGCRRYCGARGWFDAVYTPVGGAD